MSQTYAAVDDSGDPTGAADWQERMAAWPAVRAYKDMTRELLAGVAPMLVTRAGGTVVAAEPDQESLVIAVPGVAVPLCDRVKALRRDIGYRNGRLASRLPELFARVGLEELTVAGFPLVLTDPDDAFGLAGWPRLWRDAGVAWFSPAELAEWDEGMAPAHDGGLVYSLTVLVVAGRHG